MGQYYAVTLIRERDKKIQSFNRTVDGQYTMAKLMEHSWFLNPFVNTICSMLYNTPTRVYWCGDYAADDLEEDLKHVLAPTDIKNKLESINVLSNDIRNKLFADFKFPTNAEKHVIDKINETIDMCYFSQGIYQTSEPIPKKHYYNKQTYKTKTVIESRLQKLLSNSKYNVKQSSLNKEVHESQITLWNKFLVNDTQHIYLDCNEYTNLNWINENCIHPLPLLTAVGNGLGGGDYSGTDEQYVGSWAGDVIYITNKAPANCKKVSYEFKESYDIKAEKQTQIQNDIVNDLQSIAKSLNLEHKSVKSAIASLTENDKNEIISKLLKQIKTLNKPM